MSAIIELFGRSVEKQGEDWGQIALDLSTDAEGIGICLGLQAEARVELEEILQALQAKLSSVTLFVPRF